MENPMDLYSNDKSYSGWWYTYPSKKNEFVSWASEIPKMWKTKFMFQTTTQINHSPIINHCQPVLTITNHYWPSLSLDNHTHIYTHISI